MSVPPRKPHTLLAYHTETNPAGTALKPYLLCKSYKLVEVEASAEARRSTDLDGGPLPGVPTF